MRQKCEHCGKTMRLRKKTQDWTHKSPQDWMKCPGPNGFQQFYQQNYTTLLREAMAGGMTHPKHK